jgi:demethylmenaquinone methyltransferase/2-methoxy-6-polyprenyl-1,4-benzoquinol methylase
MFDHFGLLAPIYEKAIPFKNLELMTELVKLPIQGALLDVGGGTGRVAFNLAPFVTSVTVSDISMGMLKRAKQKSGLDIICAQSESLCLASHSFDRVIMVDAFHHVIDQSATAMDIWRVLKPGGRLVIGEPDISKISVKFVAIAEKLALMRSHFVSPEGIGRLFRYPNSLVNIVRVGFNAWIIVDKS